MKDKILPLLATCAILVSTATAADSYKISPDKSKVTFTIKNMPPGQKSFSDVPGSFKKFSGTMSLEGANPSVELEIQTTSVDTANERRDAHLRNQDFFKVKEFPTMSFKSTSVKKTSADTYDVAGNFTLLGKSKPLTAKFKLTGPHAGKTSFRIKRSEYGMNFRLPDTADEVDVTLEIVGAK